MASASPNPLQQPVCLVALSEGAVKTAWNRWEKARFSSLPFTFGKELALS